MSENLNNTPEENQGADQFYSQQETADESVSKKTSFFTINTILNLVLLVGLIILYILFFTKKPDVQVMQPPMALQKSGGKSLSVVFVNIDSLNLQYEFVKVLRTNLEGTGKKLQAEVLSEQAALEKEAADLQKQMSTNAITEEKAKGIYQGLMQKQQILAEKKDRYTQQVGNQEVDMNLRLLDTITNFLKRYNRIYKFDYILAHKTAGDILISNDTLDITREVIRELNREYQARKK
ncbi:MAG: OmpH family outer membrane protein [Bacteroidota bacterium]